MVTRRSATQTDAPPGALPRFTAVPLRARHDGWTPQRQRRFIEALASTGCVAEAARAAQMSLEACYVLRRRPNAHEFRRAWEQALDLACELLEDVAMTRAIGGVETPVYHFGEVVGTRRVYNDRLLMFLLRNRAPNRFAADSYQNADAAPKSQLERLKREWRAEWEAERRVETARNAGEVTAGLNAKLDLMRQRHLAQMSPHTRRLREAFEESQRRDKASGYLPGDEQRDEDRDEDAEAAE